MFLLKASVGVSTEPCFFDDSTADRWNRERRTSSCDPLIADADTRGSADKETHNYHLDVVLSVRALCAVCVGSVAQEFLCSLSCRFSHRTDTLSFIAQRMSWRLSSIL